MWEWWFYFCLRFRHQFFKAYQIGWWVVFLKNVFGLEGAIEKCVGCFLLYLLFGFFLLKTAVCVIILKNALLPHFYVHLWLGRVYAKRRVLGSCRTHYWFQTTERSLNSFFQIELQESINRKASLGDIYKEKTIPQTLGAEGATNVPLLWWTNLA